VVALMLDGENVYEIKNFTGQLAPAVDPPLTADRVIVERRWAWTLVLPTDLTRASSAGSPRSWPRGRGAAGLDVRVCSLPGCSGQEGGGTLRHCRLPIGSFLPAGPWSGYRLRFRVS